ncbi:MAG: MFS transporter [Microbacteriaceae bacterium]|jgi:MFS family permease|nr:MFS transporter [Microbacteriaceae bacterium]HOA86003.1 MFS transporter [Microbacteriaceae bacterium]HPZ33822.1 MFS transporter [Microbacteriaceae bacterium]
MITQAPTLRSQIRAVYAPGMCMTLGVGSAIPIIPHAAVLLGGTLAVAAILVALLPVARALYDIPGGAVLARLGIRRTMTLACAVALVGFIAAATGVAIWLLALGVALAGLGSVALLVAQQTYLTSVVPGDRRPAAMTTLAALASAGALVGPLIGAAIIKLVSVWAVLWWCGAMAAIAVILVATAAALRGDAAGATVERTHERRVFSQTRGVILTLGVAAALACVVRGAPQFGLPLWTEHLRFDPAVTSLVYALYAAGNLATTPLSARLSTRFGRLVPLATTFAVSAVALAALPFTSTEASVAVCALVLGAGVGFGNGLLLTIAGDVVHENQAQFFGIWRALMDGGSALAPLVLAVASAASALGVGVLVTASIALPGWLIAARFLPRLTPQASRRTRREAGLPIASG